MAVNDQTSTPVRPFGLARIVQAAAVTTVLATVLAAAGGVWAAGSATRCDQPQAAPASPAAAQTENTDAFALGDPYLRIVDVGPGEAKLQIASKSFVKSGGAGPVVHLTGAIHIADAGFYTSLQTMLDKMDVVLFEGVRPKGGSRLPADATDDQRQTATKDRVEMVAGIVKAMWEATGTMPRSLAEIGEAKPKLKSMLDDLAIDGWGKPIGIEVIGAEAKPADKTVDTDSASEKNADAGKSIRVFSNGKDHQTGGGGLSGDVEKIVTAPKSGAAKNKNLQEKLAKAFGLSYQGEAMNTGKPNWRSSDLSIDQIIQRAKESGGDASMLLSMLDGNSMLAKLGGFVLGFIEASPALRATMKVTLVEVLANADPEAGGAALGKGGGALMKVIIEDRNDVVLSDLEKIISSEPNIKSVSAFYGAGHMADMEKKLASRYGYTPGETVWIDAVLLSAKEMGISEKDFAKMRKSASASAKSMIKKAK